MSDLGWDHPLIDYYYDVKLGGVGSWTFRLDRAPNSIQVFLNRAVQLPVTHQIGSGSRKSNTG